MPEGGRLIKLSNNFLEPRKMRSFCNSSVRKTKYHGKIKETLFVQEPNPTG